MQLINNDCIAAMKAMPDNSVDSIITDPPYELGFMGKSWDASGIAFNVDVWREALRVIKPGGHLIAFSGSRTYHRMAVAIEDAGFEIRDQIMWVYGSGFPKSHDVSKAIDKNNGETGRLLKFTNWMRTTGLKAKELDEATGTNMGGHYLTTASQPAIPTVELWQKIRPLVADVPEWVDELVDRIEAEREVVGSKTAGMGSGKTFGMLQSEGFNFQANQEIDITAPATAAAKQWQGWGTALKPAHEPMVLARKPLIGTVANNVLTYGTGGLNIDGGRVGRAEGDDSSAGNRTATFGTQDTESGGDGSGGWEQNTAGRFPANFIHDGSDEVVAGFPNVKGATSRTNASQEASDNAMFGGGFAGAVYDDGLNTSAARFFYCAKASKKDRNEGLDGFIGKEIGAKGNGLARQCATCRASVLDGCQCVDRTFVNPTRQNHHPTVKPTSLMQYLVRLVTPPNGTVLDPFMGSGSTGKACAYEGFEFIGIDQSAEYVAIAKARIDFALGDKELEFNFDSK